MTDSSRFMTYVPGYANDVFLSYAHGDDPRWIKEFEEALARTIRGRLGHEISVWQDLKRLRVGQDWQTDIANAIAKTAASSLCSLPAIRPRTGARGS